MSLDNPQLRARKPSGRVPCPFLLLEGEEGSGKSWAAAVLSSSDRVGRTFWLDLNEGSADEYGAIPGARFEVLDHDGTYAQVLEQVLAVREVAKAAHAAGEPPTVLVIDTLLDVWDGLKDWVSERAKAKPANQRKLAEDPAAELDVSRNLWNDAGNRHKRLINVLKTFPGIVVGITQGKVISDTDPSTGQPYRDGRKTYRVEGHPKLGYDASVIVRMLRGQPPQITKARSVHAGVDPSGPPVVLEGKREPKGPLLEWLIFDVLKVDAGSPVRELVSMTGGDLLPEEAADEESIAAADAAEAERSARARANDGRRGQPRQQQPEQQPGITAGEYAARLETIGPDRELTAAMVADVEGSGLIDESVKFRGNTMTLGGALALVKVEARERANAAAAPAAQETPQEAQEAAQEPPTAPPATEEPAAPPPAPESGAQETPQAAALDTARAALVADDPDVVLSFYNGSGDLAQVDVSEAIDDDDLATIGLNPEEVRGAPIPLGGLLIRVGQYVKRHGNAVRYVGRPTTEDEPLDPWAADAAAGWPDKNKGPE